MTEFPASWPPRTSRLRRCCVLIIVECGKFLRRTIQISRRLKILQPLLYTRREISSQINQKNDNKRYLSVFAEMWFSIDFVFWSMLIAFRPHRHFRRHFASFASVLISILCKFCGNLISLSDLDVQGNSPQVNDFSKVLFIL